MRQVISLLPVGGHRTGADGTAVVGVVAAHIVEGAAHTGLEEVVDHREKLDILAEEVVLPAIGKGTIRMDHVMLPGVTYIWRISGGLTLTLASRLLCTISNCSSAASCCHLGCELWERRVSMGKRE